MLRLSSDLEVIDDPKGPLIDDIHGVADGVRDIDQFGEATDRGTQLSRVSFRVDVIGIHHRRHASKRLLAAPHRQRRYQPDSRGEQNRPTISHLEFYFNRSCVL